jgi:hypothetical protein
MWCSVVGRVGGSMLSLGIEQSANIGVSFPIQLSNSDDSHWPQQRATSMLSMYLGYLLALRMACLCQ